MSTSQVTGNDIIAFSISNILAVFVATIAAKYRNPARTMLSAIFGLAAIVNLYLAYSTPAVYLTFADTAIAPYRHFINGPFSTIIQPLVTAIAIGQLLIASAIWCKGNLRRIGCYGGIIFCVAIAPLGWGAAFPSTLLLAFAFLRLHTNDHYANQYQS